MLSREACMPSFTHLGDDVKCESVKLLKRLKYAEGSEGKVGSPVAKVSGALRKEATSAVLDK